MPGLGNETGTEVAGGTSRIASGVNAGCEGMVSDPAQYAMHPAHGDPCTEPWQVFCA